MVCKTTMFFDHLHLEKIILQSDWWALAAETPDSHYSNNSGVMLSDHLLAVHENVERIFQYKNEGFFGQMFDLIPRLNLKKEEVYEELRIVALLHDIGKVKEDKTLVIPHPLTGKPAHMRHGVVSLMATMEIIGSDLLNWPERRNRIYRTVELHDMSYGLFREYHSTGNLPGNDKWDYINNKIHTITGGGLYYLLLFKLADTHGHANFSDVTWFYENVKKEYFDRLHLPIPLPGPGDIR